jgi:hypothetical protein
MPISLLSRLSDDSRFQELCGKVEESIPSGDKGIRYNKDMSAIEKKDVVKGLKEAIYSLLEYISVKAQ